MICETAIKTGKQVFVPAFRKPFLNVSDDEKAM
jgi:hypothetical protein